MLADLLRCRWLVEVYTERYESTQQDSQRDSLARTTTPKLRHKAFVPLPGHIRALVSLEHLR